MMRVLRWSVVLSTFVIAMQANAALVLDIKPSAIQQGVQIKLADIGELRGEARDVELARTIALPARGRVGDTVAYTRNDVLKALQQQAPALMTQQQMIGATRVVVQREGHLLSAGDYVNYAKQELAKCLASIDGEIEINPKGEYGDIGIPHGGYRLSARCGSTELRSTMQITVDVVVDGIAYRSIPVVFAVGWYRQVLLLNRSVGMHSEVTSDMVDIRRANVASLTSEALRLPEQFAGRWTRRALEAGAVLQQSDIEKKPDVCAGELLNIMASVGGVTIQTKGVAEKSGFIGQRIPAHLAHSDNRLIVDILNKGLAIVGNTQIQK